MHQPATPPASLRRSPWFHQRPRLTLAVIAALYVAVLILRLLAGNAVDAYSMLYVLPVALAATAFGRRAGLVAGLLAVLLIVVWAVVRHVSLSPTAWATRAVPILLLGVLLGGAMDQLRKAEEEGRRLQLAAVLHREAIEINDSLIQRMTAAKWALEAGRTDTALEILATAMSDAQRLVSGLIKRAGMADQTAAPPVLPQPTPHP